MFLVSVLCILCVSVRQTDGRVTPLMKLPEKLQRMFDTSYHMGDLNTKSGQLAFWECLENYIPALMKNKPLDIPAGMTTEIMANITQFMQPLVNPSYRKKRQTKEIRIRYEIRSMPSDKLYNYFQAVNLMKRHVIVPARPGKPALSMYDTLASLHGDSYLSSTAHNGPAFLAWHRFYLWIYESYLRQYVPGVTIPYWGSILDSEMHYPTRSVIFTPEFFGSGIGTIDGPFAGWDTLNPKTAFFRNFDQHIDLMSYDSYDKIMSKERNWQILKPTTEPDSDIEFAHSRSHVFVGGSMASLANAVRDPIFFSHHAFIDKTWEDFRLKQDRIGIKLDLDYPWKDNDEMFHDGHGPHNLTGFSFVTGEYPDGTLKRSDAFNMQNLVGLSRVWFDLVRYDPLPTCIGINTCDGNMFLKCNANSRCTSLSGSAARKGRAGRRKRAILSEDGTCERPPLISDIKSRIDDRGISSISIEKHREWVYIPLQIIAKRSPTYEHFTDYSLYNDQSKGLGLKNIFTHAGNPHSFKSCIKNQDSVRRLKIMSYGLNYYGYNEEYAINDNRFGMSVSSGFIPVKNPGDGASEALIAVSDSCGRVCRPYCKHGTQIYKTTGAIRVTSEYPKQYSFNHGDATLNSWHLDSQHACPEQDERHLPITFFCEYTDTWYWNHPTSKRPDPPVHYIDERLLNPTLGYQDPIPPVLTHSTVGYGRRNERINTNTAYEGRPHRRYDIPRSRHYNTNTGRTQAYNWSNMTSYRRQNTSARPQNLEGQPRNAIVGQTARRRQHHRNTKRLKNYFGK